MLYRFLILFCLMLCTSCKSDAQPFAVFRQGSVQPVIAADPSLTTLGNDFKQAFEKATGSMLSVSGSGPIIELRLVKHDTPFYSIEQKDNRVIISGSSENEVAAGISYFFSEYAGIIIGETYKLGVKEIIVPKGLSYRSELAFEYREPYFPDNFNAGFRKWNTTQTLEENWALWGHNIGKAVKVIPAMYAVVNGKPNEEQFCFSSPELEQELINFIDRSRREDPARNKFMIMPNDNNFVCHCNKCQAVGNTKTNASPAVFSLLNRLAKKFPEQQFFSTAYITTAQPPVFALEKNTGVMISTMPFQKGVVIGKSATESKINKTVTDWKKVADKIYLWDYAVNFDNYFDAYPTLLIAQQNLKYYKKLGVTGVFMHGSEEYYSAFGGLKAYIYAQLLQNTDIDIDKHIKRYFENKYPAVSDLLYGYYTGIEKRAFESVRTLDIYGGINQSYKKYLDDKQLKDFYEALSAKAATLSLPEQKRLSPLLASLALQRLEVMRTNAFESNGYGTYNYDNATVKLSPKVSELMNSLKQYSAQAGITMYNESGFTVTGYIQQWQDNIIAAEYKNWFYGKKMQSRFEPEEDYPNVSMLNDGNIGFSDYYNNWFIAVKNTISVEVNVTDVKNARTVEMAFLNDTRHNIYLPEKVIVSVSGRKYEAIVTTVRNLSKSKIVLPFELKPEDKLITIEVIKQKAYKNKSVACDEIYFK